MKPAANVYLRCARFCTIMKFTKCLENSFRKAWQQFEIHFFKIFDSRLNALSILNNTSESTLSLNHTITFEVSIKLSRKNNSYTKK